MEIGKSNNEQLSAVIIEPVNDVKKEKSKHEEKRN
jgi:hypothetical protein